MKGFQIHRYTILHIILILMYRTEVLHQIPNQAVVMFQYCAHLLLVNRDSGHVLHPCEEKIYLLVSDRKALISVGSQYRHQDLFYHLRLDAFLQGRYTEGEE